MTEEMSSRREEILEYNYEDLLEISNFLNNFNNDLVIDKQSHEVIRDNVSKFFPCPDNMEGCMYNVDEKWWKYEDRDQWIYYTYFYNISDKGVYVIIERDADRCGNLDVSAFLIKDQKIIKYNCHDCVGGHNNTFYFTKGLGYACDFPKHLMYLRCGSHLPEYDIEDVPAVTKFIDFLQEYLTNFEKSIESDDPTNLEKGVEEDVIHSTYMLDFICHLDNLLKNVKSQINKNN